MKKKIQAAVFLLIFACSTVSVTVPAYADPETSSEVTTEAENASHDCSLSSLKIAQATLQPEFRPEQLTYTITVPNEVTRIALTAETSEPGAKKVINGTGDLKVGENLVTIVVTAEDGSVREYRVTVTREEEPEGATTEPEESRSEEATEGEELPSGSDDETAENDRETEETPSESKNSPMETGTSGENEAAADKMSGRRLLILVLCIFCLVLLFVIIAALLLRRNPVEDDEDEDEEEKEEEGDRRRDRHAPKESPYDELRDDTEDREEDSDDGAESVTPEELALFYQSLRVDSEPEPAKTEADHAEAEEEEIEMDDLDDLDDDFELLEEDDDFDFLDF